MVFASLTFLLYFLPLTLVLYYLIPREKYQNSILILASLIFYAWGEPVWVILLIFSATVDYFHGQIIERHRGKWQSKAALCSSLFINLGLLVIFKYSAMIAETFTVLTPFTWEVPRFSLPIGISFYTFQTLSYTFDVYRNEVRAQSSYLKFLLFVSLFHQLVAGPIVRYAEIESSINHRTFKVHRFSSGITRFAFGLAKKVLLANTAGALAVPFLEGDISSLSVLGAWYGIFLFALQIYFDFSGYSDMAIGLGRMFGFEYNENFRYPYISRSVSDFWRRWHISLGSFFRDYLYIPLGGNRRAMVRNLLIVWFLTGLWHGASWNFVLWGLYYGVLILLEKLISRRMNVSVPRVFQHLYLILITLVGWTFFYFSDFSRMGNFLMTMGGHGNGWISLALSLSVKGNLFFLLVAVLACLPWYPFLTNLLANRSSLGVLKLVSKPLISISLIGMALLFLAASGYNPFLYFRF